jgi:hypothetical protein
VSEPRSSTWAQERFGEIADDLARAVARAIYQAHDVAMSAHISGGLQSNDTYGVTLHVAQYEQLAAETEGLPDVSIRKPKGVRGRFDLVIIEDRRIVLYPWRYATDKSVLREKARLRPPVSDLRKTLLALNENTIDGQLTLEQAEIDWEQLADELAEEQAMLDELARLGRVVTVGYASNPGGGVFDLGWGEVELVDEETGRVVWRHWEQLAPPVERADGAGWRQPVSASAADGRERARRFDEAGAEDELGLRPRPPVPDAPISEPERPQKETSSDEP